MGSRAAAPAAAMLSADSLRTERTRHLCACGSILQKYALTTAHAAVSQSWTIGCTEGCAHKESISPLHRSRLLATTPPPPTPHRPSRSWTCLRSHRPNNVQIDAILAAEEGVCGGCCFYISNSQNQRKKKRAENSCFLPPGIIKNSRVTLHLPNNLFIKNVSVETIWTRS